MFPTGRSYRERSLRKLGRPPNGRSGWQRQFHAAERADVPPDGFRKIGRASRFRREAGFEYGTRFLFHGEPMAGGANTQPGFECVVQFSNGEARHMSMMALQSSLRA